MKKPDATTLFKIDGTANAYAIIAAPVTRVA